jgi:hypothetical protein
MARSSRTRPSVSGVGFASLFPLTTEVYPMPALHNTAIRLFAATCAAALLSACTHFYDEELNESTVASQSYLPGQPGGVASSITTVEADVIGIDYKKRIVVLQDAQGNRRTLTIGKEAVNFDQVKVGDHVTMEIASEILVFMQDAPSEAINTERSVELKAPKGDKPAMLAADIQQLSAVITAVDVATHQATLTFEDGRVQTVTVRPDVELSQTMVGQTMVIRLTDAITLSVTGS